MATTGIPSIVYKKAVLSQGNCDAAAVLFGSKFTDNIHYKFKTSFESQAS